MWKTIHYGAYEISKGGKIRRVKPAKGAVVGRILKPWLGNPNDECPKVSLHYNNVRKDVKVETLIKRAYGRR